MSAGDAPRAYHHGNRSAFGGGLHQPILGLALEISVGIVPDRTRERVVRINRRPAGHRERKTYPGQSRRVHQALGESAVICDVLVEPHLGDSAPGKKCTVHHHCRMEGDHLTVIPSAAVDFVITDADGPGMAGHGQRRQVEWGEQVEGCPPEPAGCAGDQDSVVTERVRGECARMRAHQVGHVTGRELMAQ